MARGAVYQAGWVVGRFRPLEAIGLSLWQVTRSRQ